MKKIIIILIVGLFGLASCHTEPIHRISQYLHFDNEPNEHILAQVFEGCVLVDEWEGQIDRVPVTVTEGVYTLRITYDNGDYFTYRFTACIENELNYIYNE